MSDDSGTNSKKKIVLAGAGTGGMAAIHYLRKNNPEIDVQAFEGRDFIGGRLSAEVVDGYHLDRGASIFIESYKTIREVAKDLDVKFELAPVKKGGIICSKGKMLALMPLGTLPQILETGWNLVTFKLMSLGASLQFLKFRKYCQKNSATISVDDHDQLLSYDTHPDFIEFGKEHGFAKAIEEHFRHDLRAYATGTNVSPAAAISALWGISLNLDNAIEVPPTGVGTLMTHVADKYREHVQLSSPVKEIVIENGEVKGVRGEDGNLVEADAVICNATANRAIDIIPELPSEFRDLMSQVEYTRAVKFHIATDFPLLAENAYACLFKDDEVTWLSTVENSNAIGPQAMPKGTYLYNAIAMDEAADKLLDKDDEYITEAFMKELTRFYPALATKKPLLTHIYKWDEAGAIIKGGLFTKIHTMLNKDLPEKVKGLYFCGDWTFMATTNSAMKSGKTAAEKATAYVNATG